MTEPRTEAGRALYAQKRIHNIAQRVAADDRHDARWLSDILAIEAEAATPPALDVERLRQAMGSVFGNADDPAHLRIARILANEYAALSPTGDET